MHLENEARHQAAAEARELEAKKAAENAEHERNRPRTFEEKYRHMTARDTISPTAQFIRALVDRQGVAAKLTPIFQRIRPALTEYARLNNERKEIGPNAARMLVKAHIATQHAKALAGQDTSEQYPNAELLEADFAVRRSALRERMKAICTEVNKEVGAVGEILKTAARKQTEELSAAERAAAKAMDHPYEPSVMLRASAAAGMNIDYIVKVQCMLIPGMDIDCFLFGLIEL